jgi:hypothetical protein
MFKNERSRKFNYKGGRKGIILLCLRNYVNEERGHKNRKVGLKLRLVHVKETMHDMLNMPMNELRHVWLLERLCPQEFAKLKAIKHRYHVWKDYSKRDNERIAKWNARTKEVYEREIHSRTIVAKQGVLEDFWFKPYTGKFSGKKFAKEYARKRHAYRSTTLDKRRTSYQPLDQRMKKTKEE